MTRLIRTLLTAVAALALAGIALPVQAQSALPIPDGPVARDVPGAKELPDPDRVYKIVFDIGDDAPSLDEPHPKLNMIANVLNTLAKYGVPAANRKIVVVIHHRTKGIDMILNDETYAARNPGHPKNPNIPLIKALTKAGVDFRVCGQGVLAHKLDPKTILPEIQIDLWAMTTLLNLQLDGYVHVGG